LLSVCFVFFLFSCEEKKSHEITQLKTAQTIDELSDSSFFKDVTHISYYKDFFYVADSYNGRIVKLDNNLNLALSMGRTGEGPGEFLGMNCVGSYKDTLYAASSRSLKMNRFTIDGDFIDDHRILDYSMISNYFCIDNKGGLYFNSIFDSAPVVKFDRLMNRQFAFGTWIEAETEERKIALNNFQVLYFQNKILTVQCEEPLISLYEEDGTLMLSQKIDSDVFKSRLQFKQQQLGISPSAQQNKNVYMLFCSITSYENKLYMLYIDHDKESNRPRCNKLIELSYEDNEFKIDNIYQLEDSWYTAICCVKDRLICFSATRSELQVYNLGN
jgi:hypothetical protein